MTVRRGLGGLIEVPYGHPDVDSIWIVDESAADEKEFANFTHKTVKKRLNEINSFEIKFMDVQSADKAWIEEGNTVKIFDESRLILRGMIEEVVYDSDYECTIRGYGMEAKLLHRILLSRTDYYTTATAVSTIVTALLADVDAISAGDNSISTTVSVRFEYDNRLRNLMELCKAFGYDWWVSTRNDGVEGWPFDTDYLHVKDGRGSGVSKKTFYTGGSNQNAEMVEKLVDKSKMVNDITCLGYGDGINQLSSHTTSATSISTYGTVDRTFVDKAILNQTTLDSWRDNIIEDYSAPIVRISLRVYDVHFDTEIHCGDTITIEDTATALTGTYTVVGIIRTYSDELGEELVYECSNVRVSFESELADVQRESRAPAVYAQGSIVTDNLAEHENLDADTDLDMRFYLPADIITINKALLSFKLKDFRAYTAVSQAATAAGGGSQETFATDDFSAPALTQGDWVNIDSHTFGASSATQVVLCNMSMYSLASASVVNVRINDGTLNYPDDTGVAAYIDNTDFLAQNWAILYPGDAAGKTITIQGKAADDDVTTRASTLIQGIGEHTHSITMDFGIYEDTQTGKSVTVSAGQDGSESAVATYTSDQTGIDLKTQLVDAYTTNGAGWYNINVTANKVLRVEANLFLKYF